MKIEDLTVHSYRIQFKLGTSRSGILIKITDEAGNSEWGDIAPLPHWSKESVDESLNQINSLKRSIKAIHWKFDSLWNEMATLKLYPSVSFGLSSALLSLLMPITKPCLIPACALLMGSLEEIVEQSKQRWVEGFTYAKLKVSQLTFEEAFYLISVLKDSFRLRIDVNRAWKTEDSLNFFSKFPLNTFDYVEEPFQNPNDLDKFTHPLAIDESFPHFLSLEKIETFPSLKALIYKPTLQAGVVDCLSVNQWAKKRGVSIVLSSCFESDIGLCHLASMAHRLSLNAPIGIGTFHFMQNYLCAIPIKFFQSKLQIPHLLAPETEKIISFNSE